MRTIEISDEVADALEARASRAGLPISGVLHILASSSEADDAPIRSHPEVMSGDDCVRNTRIPVWLLVSAKRQGQTDAELLESYPSLNTLDLTAAWTHKAERGGGLGGVGRFCSRRMVRAGEKPCGSARRHEPSGYRLRAHGSSLIAGGTTP